MPKGSKRKSVLGEARAWATKRGLFGPQAFLKYVILRFTENLNQVSDDIVFKGGNLLWVYIGTPRATVDLDLTTLKTKGHDRARELIERACAHESEIEFSIEAFKEVEQQGKLGAALVIGYRTEQGARNRFEVDLVYALMTDTHEIPSPIHPEVKLRSATLENIIVDKISACHRFEASNSRMKDFDDLWRLSRSDARVESNRLKKLLTARKVEPALDSRWITSDLDRLWRQHRKRYPYLPESLAFVLSEVNAWILKTLE